MSICHFGLCNMYNMWSQKHKSKRHKWQNMDMQVWTNRTRKTKTSCVNMFLAVLFFDSSWTLLTCSTKGDMSNMGEKQETCLEITFDCFIRIGQEEEIPWMPLTNKDMPFQSFTKQSLKNSTKPKKGWKLWSLAERFEKLADHAFWKISLSWL